MLRFIRKYQLFILVIGGSLLMVVFLLEPVLTRLAPSPMKAKVAELADGSTFTRADTQRANVAISLLRRVHPRALGPRSVGGIGLDPSNESSMALHWLLLVKQAETAELVGEAGDGVSWINELAQMEARVIVISEAQQGLITSDEQAEQRLVELTNQISNTMHTKATRSAGMARSTLDDVYRILAQARGVYRLLSAIQTMPSFSDVNAIHAAHETLDAVAINAALLDSSLAAAAVAEPTDEQLQSFFDQYKAQSPEDNEYRIGYTQPTRITLGWLTLDKNVFMNAVKVDRVELHKLWSQNRDQYPEEFPVEKFNLERQYRERIGTDMMVDADRIIRAQIITATKGLPKTNGVLILPDDWEARRPKLEDIARLVVERINERFSVSIPTPAITIITDRWLTGNDIASLPGYGSSTYRVGSRQLPAYTLPQFFELEEPNTLGLDVQVGLPMVDPAAEDQLGNRYYAVVLDARAQGPAESIDDVTRARVVADYKSVEGFKMLRDRIEEFKAAIESNGDLAPAIELATSLVPNPESVRMPEVKRNILVRRDSIDRGRLTSFVEPSLNVESFRSAVIAAAADIDPLASPEAVAADPIAVVVALPESRSVAISRVVAPRPVSIEQFRALSNRVVATAGQRELAQAAEGLEDPFSFEALSARYGLTWLDEDRDPDNTDPEKAPDANTDESAPAEEAAQG